MVSIKGYSLYHLTLILRQYSTTMNSFDKNFWSSRYADQDTGWDLGHVSGPMQYLMDILQDKQTKILLPGAGNSYEAEYLHHKGFTHVTVLDIASAPLKTIQERVPTFPAQYLIEQDFFQHEGEYEVILEQTFFCALDPVLRLSYVQQMHRLLQPKGMLAGVLFGVPLNRDKPPFGGSQEEYETLFSPYFDLHTLIPCVYSENSRAGRELLFTFFKK